MNYKNEVLIREISVEQLPTFWPVLKHWIEGAMEHHPFMDAQDTLILGFSGRLAIFVAILGDRMVGTAWVELIGYPQAVVTHILAIGGVKNGRVKEWFPPLVEHIESWGIMRGATAMSGMGRAGWARFGRMLGWKPSPLVAFTKDLSHVEGRRQPAVNTDDRTVESSPALSG